MLARRGSRDHLERADELVRVLGAQAQCQGNALLHCAGFTKIKLIGFNGLEMLGGGFVLNSMFHFSQAVKTREGLIRTQVG